MWFSHTIFKAPSLIFSKHQASTFFFDLERFYLKADFSAWFKHHQKFLSGHCTCTVSHSKIWAKTKILFVSFSCVPRNRPNPKDFAHLLLALLPPDGTKGQGKYLGCKVGLGERSITWEWWHPAPMASHPQDPSSSNLNISDSAPWQSHPDGLCQLFSRTQLVLSLCWINSQHFSPN